MVSLQTMRQQLAKIQPEVLERQHW